MALGALIAGIAQSAAKGIGGGITKHKTAKETLKELKPIQLTGTEHSAAAGAYLGQAVRGQAVTRSDIAPQISAVMDESAKTRRALIEGVSANPNMTSAGFSNVGEAVAKSTGANLRDVFAQQSAMNLQARQQAAAQIGQASTAQAVYTRQRQLLRGKLKGEKLGGILQAVGAYS